MFNLKTYEKKIKLKEKMLERKNLHMINYDKRYSISIFPFIQFKKTKEILW
jgi:hypothetical protein